MPLSPKYSKSRDVQRVVVSSIYQVFISCASTHTIKGKLPTPHLNHCPSELTDVPRCLSDSEPECVMCARQHSIIREVRRNQTRLADRHDLFVSEVHDADDGFSVVAGAFGRGVMGRKPVDP